ncbi:MAG: right-handed parallel beta-helix repeat-containing protein [Phycisphaerales bacterium]|nr:right-handed parallel beta-helix repeat-containing protein [Phycisphaerales bacterium]
MKSLLSILVVIMLALAGCTLGHADPFTHGRLAAEPHKDGPVLDPPTLHCLAAYWLVRGDENRNARVEVRYRKLGDAQWNRAPDMLRVKHGPFSDQGDRIRPAPVMIHEGVMFAGSVLDLTPDTTYELKYNLIDPDGGSAEKILTTKTFAEPKAPANMRVRHVIPGNGGGTGTQQDPFKGLAAANADAQPGDLFLLQKGTYAPVTLTRDGELNKPIIYRGASDRTEIIIDGKSSVGPAPTFKMEGRVITMNGRHDIWFENLTIANAYGGIQAPNCMRIVVRGCHFHHLISGIQSTPPPYPTKAQADEFPKPPHITQGYFFVSDNLFEGIFPYPATRAEWGSWPESRAVWVSGLGNIFCYNRVKGWKDGIDTQDSIQSVSNDFHNNEISECFDDGIELDGADRNNRCFDNRMTNIHTGISFQPIHGGPVYAYRNALYNVQGAIFKLNNNPSGCFIFHNTATKTGGPLLQGWTARSITNVHLFNNLFLGHNCTRTVDYDQPLFGCSSDYNGYGGSDPKADTFMKWAGIRYKTLEEVRAKSPYERNCIMVDPKTAFASGLQPPTDYKTNYDPKLIDLRLAPTSNAIAAGRHIPGYTKTKTPTLGAFEPNTNLPHYGPRP